MLHDILLYSHDLETYVCYIPKKVSISDFYHSSRFLLT